MWRWRCCEVRLHCRPRATSPSCRRLVRPGRTRILLRCQTTWSRDLAPGPLRSRAPKSSGCGRPNERPLRGVVELQELVLSTSRNASELYRISTRRAGNPDNLEAVGDNRAWLYPFSIKDGVK